MPTYYTAVDSRVMREFRDVVNEKYRHIPKFLPTPNLDKWDGENIYRWYHRPGPLWPRAEQPLWPASMLEGITYTVVMHVQMQLAYLMGFAKMLIAGMDHTISSKEHFWGVDEGMSGGPNMDDVAEGYKILREGMGVEMLNISTHTMLSEKCIPCDDWKRYA